MAQIARLAGRFIFGAQLLIRGPLVLAAPLVFASSNPPEADQATPPPAPQTRQRPCTAPVHRHFDFWIGQWDVIRADGKFAGANRITSLDGGCALHEEWSSAAGGYTGQSLNSVGPDGKWHQTWVDSSGLRLELAGGLVGSNMVLEGGTPSGDPKQPATMNRITWTPETPNRVRQHWETSADLGKTWATAFDGKYHRIPEAAAAGDSFLTRLQGGWIGVGQLMKRESHVELHVERTLGRPLFELRWRSVVGSDPRSLFEGAAVYEDKGAGELVGTWWDSQGAKHAIKSSASESALTSLWGENGRTIYSFLTTGELEVVDSVKRPDGSWGEFARATLKRK